MSFESSRSRGRIATLLILLLPILTVIVSFALSMSSTFLSANPYVSFIFTIPSFASYILLLSSMKGLANYYSEPKIFKNSLYAFVVSTGAAIAFLIASSILFTPLLDQLSAYVANPASLPSASLFVSLLQVLAFIWIAMFVTAVLNGFFYRRAFYALAEKSGEQHFKQAGLLMFIGGILTIIIVGGLLFFIGLIFAVLGFFSMKPKDSQNQPPSETL